MKTKLRGCGLEGKGFTLIELLVVIAIIGILTATLLPVVITARINTKKKMALMEAGRIVTAIRHYETQYSRFPVSDTVQTTAGATQTDITYGGAILTAALAPATFPDNSEVICILMDITDFPAGGPTINVNHQKNPQRIPFLEAKMVTEANRPAVGPDLVYRDPWGNPYIITMDLNCDGKCNDALYQRTSVSQQSGNSGINGLSNPDAKPDNFQYHGTVMVWSAGPDGKIDPNPGNVASGKANAGVNKDNILSWTQ